MPITQDRMLALIAAGEDYQQALAQARELITTNRNRVLDGQISPQDAINLLSQFIVPELLLKSPSRSESTLYIERKHFNSNAARNERAKFRKDRQRHRPKRAEHSSRQSPHYTPTNSPPMDLSMEWESNSQSDSTLPNDEELF